MFVRSLLLPRKHLDKGREDAQIAVALLVSHGHEGQDDHKPVNVIGDDGTDRGGVLPAKDGVEDTPASASVYLWVAAVDVPHRLGDVV